MIRTVVAGMLMGMMLLTSSMAFAEDVVVVPNGTKYHKADCLWLKKSKTTQTMDKKDAVAKGYKPCKRCFKEDVVKDANKK